MKDNLVSNITKFSKVTAADLSLPGRAGCTLWPTVASEGSWLRCSVALSHQSILLVLAVVVKLAPVFFFYSCFSICHKRRGKSFVVIAYLSTSLLYLLVTQGNEHFWSFRLCEEAFNWWEVVRIIEGPPNSLVGVDFLLILFWSMRVCRLPIRLSWSSWLLLCQLIVPFFLFWFWTDFACSWQSSKSKAVKKVQCENSWLSKMLILHVKLAGDPTRRSWRTSFLHHPPSAVGTNQQIWGVFVLKVVFLQASKGKGAQ